VTFGPAPATVEAAAPLGLRIETPQLSAPVTLVAANSGEQTFTWRIARKVPARMVFGLVEDARSASPKRIATDYESAAASTAKDCTLALTRAGDRLNVEIRHQSYPQGGQKGRVWSTMPWPASADLVNVSTLTAADVTRDGYLALWEGAFLRDGQEVKRVTFLVRLAAPDEPVVNMLGPDDPVKDVVPAQASQRADAAALRFLNLAELEARLVAEHAAALEDLGPNHRGTALLGDLLDKARKERQEAQRALTGPQRQQLLSAAQPTGPAVLLHSLEQQLKQLETELGPGHRQVGDLRRRVEAVRRYMKELEQDLQSATSAPTTAPAAK
jgi:hypothetical protein